MKKNSLNNKLVYLLKLFPDLQDHFRQLSQAVAQLTTFSTNTRQNNQARNRTSISIMFLITPHKSMQLRKFLGTKNINAVKVARFSVLAICADSHLQTSFQIISISDTFSTLLQMNSTIQNSSNSLSFSIPPPFLEEKLALQRSYPQHSRRAASFLFKRSVARIENGGSFNMYA